MIQRWCFHLISVKLPTTDISQENDHAIPVVKVSIKRQFCGLQLQTNSSGPTLLCIIFSRKYF
jgi:hypothetical protein